MFYDPRHWHVYTWASHPAQVRSSTQLWEPAHTLQSQCPSPCPVKELGVTSIWGTAGKKVPPVSAAGREWLAGLPSTLNKQTKKQTQARAPEGHPLGTAVDPFLGPGPAPWA